MTSKAEYRAMAMATYEITWLRYLLHDLGCKTSLPTILFCNNQAALHMTANPLFHEHTKYIEIDCHVVRKKIQKCFIRTSSVSTNKQLANLLTKHLGKDQFHFLKGKLDICDLHAPT